MIIFDKSGLKIYVVVDKIVGNVVCEGNVLGKWLISLQYVLPLILGAPWGTQEVSEEPGFEYPVMFLLSNRFRYFLHGRSEFGSG